MKSCVKWPISSAAILAGLTVAAGLLSNAVASILLDILVGVLWVSLPVALFVYLVVAIVQWRSLHWRSILPLAVALPLFYAAISLTVRIGPSVHKWVYRSKIPQYAEVVTSLTPKLTTMQIGVEERYSLPPELKELAPASVVLFRASKSAVTVKFPSHVGFGYRRGVMYQSDGEFTNGLRSTMFWPFDGMSNWCVYRE